MYCYSHKPGEPAIRSSHATAVVGKSTMRTCASMIRAALLLVQQHRIDYPLIQVVCGNEGHERFASSFEKTKTLGVIHTNYNVFKEQLWSECERRSY